MHDLYTIRERFCLHGMTILGKKDELKRMIEALDSIDTSKESMGIMKEYLNLQIKEISQFFKFVKLRFFEMADLRYRLFNAEKCLVESDVYKFSRSLS